ncbi:hypothetical protein SLOPH_1139, partial [Spraguea lophii 42_110]
MKKKDYLTNFNDIDTLDYIKSASKEISFLNNNLKKKTLAFQRLPFHKRRRNKNHIKKKTNRRRLNTKYNNNRDEDDNYNDNKTINDDDNNDNKTINDDDSNYNNNDNKTTNVKNYNKTINKDNINTTNIKKEINYNKDNNKYYLDTHRYYSKRYNMIRLYNTYLPYKRTEKTLSFISKSKHRGYMCDETYMNVYKITNNTEIKKDNRSNNYNNTEIKKDNCSNNNYNENIKTYDCNKNNIYFI